MGNQESVSNNNSYIVKKKITKSNNINLQNSRKSDNNYIIEDRSNSDFNKSRNINNDYKNNKNQQYNINNQRQYNTPQYNAPQYNTPQYNNQQYNTPQYNNKYKNIDIDNNKRLIEKQINNNALIERNTMSDLYVKNNNSSLPPYPYPSNSNNELDIPKKNFDNIKFTPFNFNEDVNKFKNQISDERTEFENNEKERRKIFDQLEEKKRSYLNNQINNFEETYNPWKILGLNKNDLNIVNIKKAYKKNALKYHPDRAGQEYQEKFQLITQSYIYLLAKANDTHGNEIKFKKKVNNSEYEDDINDGVENIHIDKDNFDINKFNKIFEEYKIPSSYDNGYSDLMKQDTIKNNDDEIFGKKFNNQIFNEHFNKIKNKKVDNSIIEYQEPNALDSSLNNLNHSILGIDNIEDYGCVNSNNLSYTDYKKAHVDETLLIDINKVKYKTYNSIDQLESDRSSISYNQSSEDKRRYEMMERKKIEDDNLRLQNQKNYDEIIQKQYKKLNQKLLR
jgi:hypothetical protein